MSSNLSTKSDEKLSTCDVNDAIKSGGSPIYINEVGGSDVSAEIEVSSSDLPKETSEEIQKKCRDRIEEYKSQIKKKMCFRDKLDMRDPQMLAEFAQEVF